MGEESGKTLDRSPLILRSGLAGSWSGMRVAVGPPGLSRSRRSLRLGPTRMVLGAIMASAVLLGSEHAQGGVG